MLWPQHQPWEWADHPGPKDRESRRGSPAVRNLKGRLGSLKDERKQREGCWEGRRRYACPFLTSHGNRGTAVDMNSIVAGGLKYYPL
jgi:hypothetical protein